MYYAVAKGRNPGIYSTWDACKEQVTGFSKAKYKKFNSETEAKKYISENGDANAPTEPSAPSSDLTNQPSASTSNTSSRPSASSGNVANQPSASRRHTSSRPSAPSMVEIPQQMQEERDKVEERSRSPTLIGMQEELKSLQSRTTSLQKQFDAYVKHKSRRRELSSVAAGSGAHNGVNGAHVTGSTGDGQRFNQRVAPEAQEIESRRVHITKESLKFDENGLLIIHTDGACGINSFGGMTAGLGVWFNDGHPLNLAEPVTGRATNDVGEIQAAVRAIETAKQHGFKRIKIVTNSQFMINAMTKWIFAWRKKDWKLASGKSVKNKKDFIALNEAMKNAFVKWELCRGHAGMLGIAAADALAREGTEKYVGGGYDYDDEDSYDSYGSDEDVPFWW